MIYCFDASSWVDCWSRWYPVSTFPSLWDKFAAMIDNEQIITSDIAIDELMGVDDGIARWLKARPIGIHDAELEVQHKLREIMNRYPKLIDNRGKSGGDPWVIATALIKNAVVVSGERRTSKTESPRIPNVCDGYRLTVMTTREFICSHGWKF